MNQPIKLRVPPVLEPWLVPGLPTVRLGQHSPGWIALHRGVRVPFEWWANAKPWERFVAVAAARALVVPGTVFCCDTALFLHGYPLGRTPQALHVAHATRSKVGRHGTVVRFQGSAVAGAPGTIGHHHPGLEPEHEGDLSLMPVDDALWNCLTRGKLEESLPPTDAHLRFRGGDEARSLLLTRAATEPMKVRREQVVGVLALADGRSESAGESLSRVAMLRLGVETPELQLAIVVNGREVRPDFAWPRCLVAGECDGRQKYLDPSLRGTARSEWDVLRAEKERDAVLLKHFRTVVHWNAEDRHPITKLRNKLLRAGVRIDLRQRTRLR